MQVINKILCMKNIMAKIEPFYKVAQQKSSCGIARDFLVLSYAFSA